MASRTPGAILPDVTGFSFSAAVEPFLRSTKTTWHSRRMRIGSRQPDKTKQAVLSAIRLPEDSELPLCVDNALASRGDCPAVICNRKRDGRGANAIDAGEHR